MDFLKFMCSKYNLYFNYLEIQLPKELNRKEEIHLHKWVDNITMEWVHCCRFFYLVLAYIHICVCVRMCDERMLMCLNMYACIEVRGQSCVFVDLHLIFLEGVLDICSDGQTTNEHWDLQVSLPPTLGLNI